MLVDYVSVFWLVDLQMIAESLEIHYLVLEALLVISEHLKLLQVVELPSDYGYQHKHVEREHEIP